MCIVKVKRKKFLEKDSSIIKSKLLNTYLLNDNGEEIKSTNENEAISAIVKNINSRGFSKLLVNFSKEFEIDELEINDDDFKESGIISDSNVLKASDFLKKVENEYFSHKKIDKEGIKSKIFLFITPIEDLRPKIGAFIIHEELFTFSSILYNSGIYTLAHEIGHEMGLIHIFENEENILNKEIYIRNLDKNLNEKKIMIEKWEKSLTTQSYPFSYTYYEGEAQKVKQVVNKKQWQELIDENKIGYKIQEVTLKKQNELLAFSKKMNEYHKIVFNQNSTENIMDYCASNNTLFYFQLEIIKKLSDEFKHI
ncbi:hypothetical protein [Flavobacterium branchiophilum]|uniref:Uncharacterized protein n=1 Tax=Flavobacterium branchiophilum TaxID=55197 RepID=A0A2H3K8N1_9FLAO|nr:hypothetical protein [Flavobacterium branchiophilum]PDS22031.1 hypothetical protein B0A77_14450 [Flavobacterium branchiophilum]